MLTFKNVNTKKQCYKQNRLSVIVVYPAMICYVLEARGRGLRFTNFQPCQNSTSSGTTFIVV